MIALIMERVTVSLKAKFKAPLSLAAVITCAYCKYVIFLAYSSLSGYDLEIVQSSFFLAFSCIFLH